MRSFRIMGRLFHSSGAALENRSNSKVFFVISLVDNGDAKTRLGGGLLAILVFMPPNVQVLQNPFIQNETNEQKIFFVVVLFRNKLPDTLRHSVSTTSLKSGLKKHDV